MASELQTAAPARKTKKEGSSSKKKLETRTTNGNQVSSTVKKETETERTLAESDTNGETPLRRSPRKKTQNSIPMVKSAIPSYRKTTPPQTSLKKPKVPLAEKSANVIDGSIKNIEVRSAPIGSSQDVIRRFRLFNPET